MAKTEKVQMLNVLRPGSTYSGDKTKYDAACAAVLKVLPKTAPGITVADLQHAVLPHLPQTLFPGGQTSGWWVKAAQLDLEARGTIARTASKPLRLHLL